MAITSRDLTEPKVTRSSGYEISSIIGALVGFTFGAVLWIFGARYTVDGVIYLTNVILRFIGAPSHVTMVWTLYLYLAFVPIVFSLVEWTCSPIGKGRVKHGGLIVAWLIVVCLDTLSTVLGLVSAKEPAALVSVVSTIYGLGILALVLTFGPEALMKSCGRLVMRAIKALFA